MLLRSIISQKTREVNHLLKTLGTSRLRELAEAAPLPRPFLDSIRPGCNLSLIAEIKRASPSKGVIRNAVQVASWVRLYEEAGASAISILTDRKFFHGSLDDLRMARGASSLPILRKDFILQPVQLYESRASGADAVLLIASILEPSRLKDLHEECEALGMTPLVEVHNEREAERALELGPKVIGINHRDLRTLEISMDLSYRLRPLIPPGVVVVAESGISGVQDAQKVAGAGVDAILVGEALMGSVEPFSLAQRLSAVRRIPWYG
jgi:indole-3-glycerol phosphate synthase